MERPPCKIVVLADTRKGIRWRNFKDVLFLIQFAVLCKFGKDSCGTMLLASRVDGAAADDGAEDTRLGELSGGNFSEVVRKNDVIGVLARFQFALLPFFAPGLPRTLCLH